MKPWRLWILLALLVFGQPLMANPIVVIPKQGGPGDLVLWKQALIICFSLTMECLALVVLLRAATGARICSILKAFVFVHLVSYPTTLLLAKPLGLYAEVFPLVFEPWFFAQVSGLAIRDSWKAVLRSNLLSFLLGLSLPHVWVRAFPFWVGGFHAP
jgi:hypothetical protein